MKGSIEKRGDTYRIRVDVGSGAGRRQQSRSGYKTKREAQAALRTWLVELDAGTAVDATRMTLGAYLEHWLTTSAANTLRATSLESYTRYIRCHIIPAIGGLPLQRVTTQQLQQFYSDKLAAGGRKDGKPGGLSRRSVAYLHMILRAALEQARRWKMVSANVALDAKPPRVVQPRAAVWSPDEVRSFLTAAAQHPYHPLWLLAVTTGLRRGELLGLRWQDVDFARGLIRVQQSIVPLHGKAHTQAPKTAGSARTVALLEEAIGALREHRKRQMRLMELAGERWPDNGLIHTTRYGTPISPVNVNAAFALLRTRADLPHITFHGLRHTHATLLMINGEQLKVVSERMGHTSVRTTADLYQHVVEQMQADAAGRLQISLFGPQTARAEQDAQHPCPIRAQDPDPTPIPTPAHQRREKGL